MKEAKSITSQLWSMANELRGTMDASEYKNYILPFMFYRYLSEEQESYIVRNGLDEYFKLGENKDELDPYIQDIVKELGYAISPQHTWKEIVHKISNHKILASDIQKLFNDFDQNVRRNPSSAADFEHVFADINIADPRLGGTSNERVQALFSIILMINEFEFKNENGQDVLGDVYEYLIGQFAASAGKKGGEFYTPHEVSRILAKLVTLDVSNHDKQFRVYDPTMGSGSLLLTVRKELPSNGRRGAVEFYGQELNTTTYNLARMNLMMHNVSYLNMNLKRGDTLDQDWPFDTKDGIDVPVRFDAVVANPPYSQKWEPSNLKDPRFKAGIAPKSKADFAFIQHGLHHLERHGTMSIVLPHGVLFRGAAEGKIRKEILLENRLDAVIGLPANLFYGTSIPTCILVFKGLEARKGKDVLFIDASQDFSKVKNKNQLSDEHIDRIINTYRERSVIDKYSYVATIEEIEDNDFNLNIPRYVDTYQEEDITPLLDIVKEMNSINEQIADTNNSIVNMLKELVTEDEEHKLGLEKLIKFMSN